MKQLGLKPNGLSREGNTLALLPEYIMPGFSCEINRAAKVARQTPAGRSVYMGANLEGLHVQPFLILVGGAPPKALLPLNAALAFMPALLGESSSRNISVTSAPWFPPGRLWREGIISSFPGRKGRKYYRGRTSWLPILSGQDLRWLYARSRRLSTCFSSFCTRPKRPSSGPLRWRGPSCHPYWERCKKEFVSWKRIFC